MFVQGHHSLEELQRLTKALTKKRIWLRHQAVVLAKRGHSAPAIARALGCSRRAVQAWVGRYNQGGLAALQERPHTGRPPRLAAADVPRFRDRLEAGPTPEDGVCTFRCQDLRRILEAEFGVSCAGGRSCCASRMVRSLTRWPTWRPTPAAPGIVSTDGSHRRGTCTEWWAGQWEPDPAAAVLPERFGGEPVADSGDCRRVRATTRQERRGSVCGPRDRERIKTVASI